MHKEKADSADVFMKHVVLGVRREVLTETVIRSMAIRCKKIELFQCCCVSSVKFPRQMYGVPGEVNPGQIL